MWNTLMRRYKEILKRKNLGVKAHWFEPLTKVEVEKLQLGKDK